MRMSTNLTAIAAGSPSRDSFTNSKRSRERTSIYYHIELRKDAGGGEGREISSELMSSEWLYSQCLPRHGVGH